MLATAITNLVLALMIQTPSIKLNNDGELCLSVDTQYIHSVTLHDFDSRNIGLCKMCNKPIIITPIDYLGVRPYYLLFYSDDLRQRENFHSDCDPWCFINTNVLYHVVNPKYGAPEAWEISGNKRED